MVEDTEPHVERKPEVKVNLKAGKAAGIIDIVTLPFSQAFMPGQIDHPLLIQIDMLIAALDE